LAAGAYWHCVLEITEESNAMPYWLIDTLKGLPLYLIAYFCVGTPWAWALLPFADRQSRVVMTAVAGALGAALITAWMFVLGTISGQTGQALLRFDLIFAGMVIMAVVGVIAVRWRGSADSVPQSVRVSFALDERVLIGMILAAVVVRWVVTSYWPFTMYDALWVYGYEARLYSLTGMIPTTIGYYPQFLPLQFTLAQLFVGGVSDHAARAVIPLLHVGTILAVYTLGVRLFTRRVGVFAAALWALYPHVGEWARAGDLEIPLTFSFTLAAVFFLLAWFGEAPRRRYAVLSGVMLGIALWTKPTAGAFALGVGLMVALDLVRVRGQWRAWLPRLEVAVLTGIACAPLGGVWYVRNLLLGHNAVDFPPSFWQTIAERGADEFSFPLLALVVTVAYLLVFYPNARKLAVGGGLALILGALLPSMFAPRRLTFIEIGLLIAGSLVLYRVLAQNFLRTTAAAGLRHDAARLGWVLVLAFPYFVVWFYSYSYHYRLSFAVVPLLILPTAVALARWITPARLAKARWRPVYGSALMLACLPSVINAVYDRNVGWDYLITGVMPDDDARYRSGNAALMNVVDGLRVWQQDHPAEPLIVAAPGVDRLPFFFPLADIRTTVVPSRLEQIADAHYFVYGSPESRMEYEAMPFLENQVVGALGRQEIVRRAWGLDDGIFRYDIYELDINARWTPVEPIEAAVDTVMFGDFARYVGFDIGGGEFWQGRRLIAHLYWEVTAPPPQDYSIYIHLRDPAGNMITGWDNPVARTDLGYYSTLMWEPGEFISDERVLQVPDEIFQSATPPESIYGDGYSIVIGMYDVNTQTRVPIFINGVPAGDGFEIESNINFTRDPEGS